MKLMVVCAVLGVAASQVQYPDRVIALGNQGGVGNSGYSVPPGSGSPNATNPSAGVFIGRNPGQLPGQATNVVLGGQGAVPAILIAASPGTFGSGFQTFPVQTLGGASAAQSPSVGGRTGTRPSPAASAGQTGASGSGSGSGSGSDSGSDSGSSSATRTGANPASDGSTPNSPNTRLFGLGNLAGGAASFLSGALGAGLANSVNRPQRPGFGNQGFGNQGFGNQGFGNQGFGNQGFGGQGFGGVNPGFGGQGFGGVNPGLGGGFNQGGFNQGLGGFNQGVGGFNQGVGGFNQGVGGFNPNINQVSPVAQSASCRRWCRTPQGQAYCCESANEPTTLPFVKPGQCPPVRPQCPPTKFNLPPRQCSNDGACGGVDKCCFDTCLQHHTCKPPLGVGK